MLNNIEELKICSKKSNEKNKIQLYFYNTLLKRGKEKKSTGYNFTNIACKFNRLRKKN